MAAARVVAANVQEILESEPHARILVLGGDCTIQLGVIAGAKAAHRGTVGLSLLSVHVDVDVLDQTRFPIAEEQRDAPGLSLEVLEHLVSGLMDHPASQVLTICEVNPSRPHDLAGAFEALIGLVARSLGTRDRDERSAADAERDDLNGREPPAPVRWRP